MTSDAGTVRGAETIADYARRVRAGLADLPVADREGLLADLEAHLTEVAGEPDAGSLVDRLGPPEAYAAELRAAAGFGPPAAGTPAGRPRLTDRPQVRAVLDFLPELRPGWWVLRGGFVAFLLALVVGGGGIALPVLLGLVTVPLSVLLGRRALTDGRLRVTSVVVNALLVLSVPVLGIAGATYTDSSSEQAPPYGVTYPDLQGVTNIYPYSSDGKPLTDVQLFDQDGNPIRLPEPTTPDGWPITAEPRYDRQGRLVENVYPQEQVAGGPQTSVELSPEAAVPPRRPVPTPEISAPALRPR